MINQVIEGVTDPSERTTPERDRAAAHTSQKKRVFKAKKDVPDFELQEIMGEFEIDDLGNFIIVRGEHGELLDKQDRLVNRRGYLIDRFGNVINNKGVVIFKVVELNIDDEIPAPFGFEKRKKNMMKVGAENKFTIQGASMLNESVDVVDEDRLNRQVRGIRETSLISASNNSDKYTAKSDLKGLRERTHDSSEMKAEVRRAQA